MDNDNYLTLNEQGLAEVSPTASQAIQNAFIDNYRQAQAEKTAQIGEAAHALGSDLEAQYGGLHGPSEYIKSRYQTPQTDQRLATLRTASQLSALNQLLNNDLANWADKAYQARRRAVARSNTKTPTNNTAKEGEVEKKVLGEGTAQQTLRSSGPGATTIYNWSQSSTGEPGYDVYDSETGKLISSTNQSKTSDSGITGLIPLERIGTGIAQVTTGLPGYLYQAINGLLGRF